MSTENRESFLINVMNKGFSRAALSFSQMIQKPVSVVNSQSLLIRHDDFSYIAEAPGDFFILSTQIIGDISGKSFLIFSSEESSEIFKTLNSSISNDALKEAFLLEIDNIISASVIAELSNSLGLEIYGDVPRLTKIHSKALESLMIQELNNEEPSSVIFCNTTFQLDAKERVHPQFIWKLSNRLFEMIPVEKTTF